MATPAPSIHAAPPPAIVTEPHGIKYATSTALGKGGFAICYKAERLNGDTPTGHVVALKIVKTKMEPQKLAQKFVTELQIHSKLSHPNIVGFHRAFAFTENTYVVLELCACGSLADLLKRRKCLTMPEIRRLMIQVCGAVKYLHTRNIVHRDLKTGNLFLDENMNVKVGDFGLAALLVSGKDMDVQRRTTMCGTPNYLAPEILDKTKGHNEKVDLWAIGIIAYTLAVGKAPFHAASREEIYTKLKAGEYSWPELSSITNDISVDLRHLVSTLLVPEELRPSPDEIVSHDFFRIAYVPLRMSPKQVTKKPTWPAHVPTPESVQRGYSDTWYAVCQETGVGQCGEKSFQLPSSKRIRSIVKDIEREIAAGRQPVLPIPADTVYTPFPYSASWGASSTMQEEVVEPPAETRRLREISNNESHVVPSIKSQGQDLEAKRKRDVDLMPPPRRRDVTVKKTRDAEHAASRPALESSSQPDSTGEATKPMTSETIATNATTSRTQPSEMTLARRPRSTRQQAAVPTPIEEKKDADIRATESPKRQQGGRTSRLKAKQAALEAIEIYSDGEEEKGVKLAIQPQSPVRSPTRSRTAAPTIRQSRRTAVMPGSDPDSVLQRLCVFRDNIAAALTHGKNGTRQTTTVKAQQLPFVSRWVDYSRKHGVGYVMDDGTIGFIASALATKSSVVPVAVRNGERWLQRVGKKLENLEKVPFHVFENTQKGLTKSPEVSARASAEEQEKQRTLRVLWVKFGRYMSQSLNGSDEDTIPDKTTSLTELQFVRFYQRMGNVGIWGFADGCLQLHFPDHTKLVLSADGLYVSATMISAEGAAVIARDHELPTRLLRDRETVHMSVGTLLDTTSSGAADAELGQIVGANMLREKLEFLLQIVEQWIAGGGLGCSKTDNTGMQWQGLWVKDHAKKVDWVTVGRWGGDDNRA